VGIPIQPIKRTSAGTGGARAERRNEPHRLSTVRATESSAPAG
jgi:hypothetical protein